MFGCSCLCWTRAWSAKLTDLESELNALDARGFSVLHYTCLHSLSELVPVLLERGADVNLRTADGRDQVRFLSGICLRLVDLAMDAGYGGELKPEEQLESCA